MECFDVDLINVLNGLYVWCMMMVWSLWFGVVWLLVGVYSLYVLYSKNFVLVGGDLIGIMFDVCGNVNDFGL